MSDLNTLLHTKLTDILTGFLNQQNENPANNQKAIQLVIPTVVAGLLNYVSKQPSHVSELFHLISGSNGQQFQDLLNQVTTQPESVVWDKIIELGKGLLPTLLGTQTHVDNTTSELATEAGISSNTAGSLLALVLPLVLALLREQSGSNSAQLAGLFTNIDSKNWLENILPIGLLRALGISSIEGIAATALAGLGTSNTMGGTATPIAEPLMAANGASMGRWVALAIAALLAIWGIKSCTSSDTTNTKQQDVQSIENTTTANNTANMATATASTVADVNDNIATTARVLADNTSEAFYEDGIVKIYFAVGSSKIAKNIQTVSNQIIDAGKSGKKLIISGYTDGTGSATTNAKLAKQRAEAVKAFLVKQNVSAANIELRKPNNTIGAAGNHVEGRRVDIRME
ncbi:OmpA family protein [Simonsiella muelleri]|uniref:OmpA-like domain-containing protein n=1 Tax=Simonsiella muelleri ATCC 29453 TaxID=641147 RepID=V9H7P5_9NEIS|nr:OmpA family protein [Simonsiella muelleri]AUX60971.1 hypothetical protein BWP33_03480 [Simonsiella muelleri ATCC 29453]EFG30244.2 hypothetical protein HMPREF9021_01872 [Simonsiella muelleri ATCC 29453]UBQ53015.1 OmpA family protein [Simonsiella muelleri]